MVGRGWAACGGGGIWCSVLRAFVNAVIMYVFSVVFFVFAVSASLFFSQPGNRI